MEVRRLDPASGLPDLIKNLDTRLRQVETKPAGSIVIQPTNTLKTTDPATGVQTIFGALPDGTTGLQQFVGDTTPPGQPTAPSLTSALSIVTVAWDGLDTTGAQPPKDYDRTDVQVSLDGTNFTVAGQLRGPDKFQYTGLNGGQVLYVRFVSYDVNQNASTPSAVSSITVVAAADDASIAAQINSVNQAATSAQATADGKNTVYYSNVQPTGGSYKVGDLWFNTADNYKLYTYSGTAWVLAQDSASAQSAAASAQSAANAAQLAANAAQATANAAQSAASSAQLAANNAQATATSAQSLASSANNAATAAQSTATSAQSLASSANNAATAAQVSANSAQSTANYAQSLAASAQSAATAAQSTANSAQSLAASANTAATAAQASANTAQSTANSKNASYYQATAPTGGSYKVGDLWFNTSANYQLSTYNGTTWVLAQDSYTALTTSQAASAYAGTKGKVWFQATAPDGGTSYGWSGTTNGSTSTLYSSSSLLRTNLNPYPNFELGSGTVNVRTNLALDPAATATTQWTNIGSAATYTKSVDNTVFHSGNSSVKASITGSGQLGLKCYISNPGMATNDTINWSVWVYPSKTMSFQPYWEGWVPAYTGAAAGSAVSCPANTWTQLTGSVTLTSAQTSATGTYGFGLYSTTAWASGDYFNVDEIVIERNSPLGTYFDGNTAASGDFTYAWSSGANNSISYQQAPSVTGWSSRWFGGNGGTGVAYQTKGGISGSAFRKLWKTATTASPNDSGINLTTKTPVTGGATYTASISSRCSVAANLVPYIVWYDSNNATISNTSTSNSFAMTANSWTRGYVTATAPANAVTADFIFGPYSGTGAAGTMPAGATLDFDQCLIEQVGVLNPYYDGSFASDRTYDMWVNTSAGNKAYTWDANSHSWLSAQDTAIAAAANSASSAMSVAQGKNVTFISATAPTASAVGDLWLDSSNGYRLNRWSGSAWVNVQDTAIATAQSTANTAQTVANGKNTTFIQSTSPTASATGDLWIDTSNGNRLNRWSGSAWVNVQDSAIASAQSSANSAMTVAQGKNVTFIAASAPTASATGDIWLDSSNGYRMNRWSGSAWVNVQDAAIAAAQSAANTAQTSANGKNTVTYSTSAASGSGTTAGDTWFQTDGSGNVIAMWNWSGSAWVSQAVGNQVIAALDAGKITTGYLAAARIQAGTITATMIATDTITANQIAAGAITASELAAGSVTASAIAANTITASALAANAVTATAIAANTITASQIAADTITAGQIAAGAITASELAAGSVSASALTANAVTATAIAADTITAAQIAAGAITASELAAGSVTASAIAAGSVNANAIAAGSITATALAANSITASAIAAGTITASAMAAGSVTAQQLAGGSVTASALAANAVTATAISSKTITTDKLVVFDSTNMVADGDFEQMAQTTWTYNSYASLDTTGTNSYTGSNALKFTNTGSAYGNCNNNIIIPVEPNAWYYWEYWYKTTAAAVPTYGVRIASAGGASSSMVVDTLPNTAQTTWAKRSGQFQIPSTVYAASARFDVSTGTTSDSIWIDAFKLRRQNGAELIVDGTITATELAAGSVTAAKIAANSVTATALAANSITATALAAQSITATALAAQSITATALAAQSITATALAAQSITSTAVAAKAITTDKLLVADTDDYVVDPYFYDSTLNGSGTTYLSSNSAVPSAGMPTVPSVLSVPAGYDFFVGDWFDIQPGDKFYVEGWATTTGTTNLGIGVWCANTRQYGGNSSAQAKLTATAVGSSASWTKWSGEVTVPSLGSGSGSAAQPPQFGRIWVGPGNAAGWWLTGFHVRRKNAAQLIVDGSLTANMLAAQSITATALAAQSITATALAAQSITATALAAQSITATALAAQSITATALAAGSITASAIAASAVDATKLAANSITATALKANSITASALAANSITATALAAQSITATALAANSITATAIAASAITASAIAAGTITATNGIVASLDAGTITAGTLSANRIGANTITADKLVVGDPANRVTDPYMSGTGAIGGATYVATSSLTVSAGAPYASASYLNARDNYEHPNGVTLWKPVAGGEQYYVEVWARATSSATQPLNIGMWVGTDQNDSNWPVAGGATVAQGQAGWVRITGSVTIPTTINGNPVTKAIPWIQIAGTSGADITNWYITGWNTRRKNAGELIVDGSITANSIAASAITGNKISAGAIDGFVINGATINGGLISTTTQAGSAVARMGPSTVHDAIHGTNNYYPGVGFGLVGGSNVLSGMYSEDGDTLTISGGNGGSAGMAYIDMRSNGITQSSYAMMSIVSRNSITISASNTGAVSSAQLELTGPQVYIANTLPYNGTVGGISFPDKFYGVSHAEMNIQETGVPNTTVWGPGMPPMSTSAGTAQNSIDASSIYHWVSNDHMSLDKTGFYSLYWLANFGSAVTGRTFLSIEPNGSGIAYGRNGISAGEDTGSLAIPSFYCPAGTIIVWHFYHTSSGSQTVNHWLKVRYLGKGIGEF